ncbi:MAG: molybdate ABC transporter substrate-binding protein [Desulfobacteraceae bacterium]|nr:MAG: molybdate ABC transporter substrate-binding protein [Desulfobacteraceae bacterium]
MMCCLFLQVTPFPAFAEEELIVSAAASLTNAMTEISRAFEMQTPGVNVRCNFAASGALVQQMSSGAPVDVFAPASIRDMDRAEAKNLIDIPTKKIFAANELILIVPSESKVPVKTISDLQEPAFRKIAVGHPDIVPAGRYAKIFLEKNGLWEAVYDRLVYANSVREVLDYVRRGEVDAGFVYATDARSLNAIDGAASGNTVRTVLAADSSLNILYPIAVTRGTQHHPAASRFCEFVTGPDSRRILAAYGFMEAE